MSSETGYEIGKVEKILEEKSIEGPNGILYVQTVSFRRPNGEIVTTEFGSEFQPINADQRLKEGQSLVLAQLPEGQGIAISDQYRLPTLAMLSLAFFLLVAVVGRRQGILAVVGMLVSLAVLVLLVVPQILAGGNPLLLSLAGASIIGAITMYLSHGWNIQSHVALVSILLTMVAVAALSHGAVVSSRLTGLGSEEAAFLQFLGTGAINLRGLLLGGIMLGALGVLDDIAVSQVAVVFELAAAKPKITFKELYRRAYTVGKTHVASLVNTLVLAYAGANLPLFLLFVTSQNTPTWIALNSEIIAEEIIRTLVGSIGLVLAVPLTTVLACAVRLKFADALSILGVADPQPHTHSH